MLRIRLNQDGVRNGGAYPLELSGLDPTVPRKFLFKNAIQVLLRTFCPDVIHVVNQHHMRLLASEVTWLIDPTLELKRLRLSNLPIMISASSSR